MKIITNTLNESLSKYTVVIDIKFLLIICLLFIFNLNELFAQIYLSSNRNYIFSQTILKPIDSESQISSLPDNVISQTVDYYTGLGQLSQTVKINSSPSHLDIIQPFELDFCGKYSKTLLPYVEVNQLLPGAFREDYLNQNQSYFYLNQIQGIDDPFAPYAITVLQKSPLLTPLKQGSFGTEYQPENNRTIDTYYETNIANEVLKMSVVEGTEASILINYSYDVGELFKVKSINEDEVESSVYTDKTGKEILKKTTDGFIEYKTYYVYDKNNRLRFIIPPEASAQLPSIGTLTSTHQLRISWITEYKYDGFDREVEKIMPEEKPVWTVYDPAGRVVLRQDGIMRENNDWLFTKYDRKGRVIMTGIYCHNISWDRETMQGYVNQTIGSGKLYQFCETRSGYSEYGYTTNLAFPQPATGFKIYTINYYDDYDFNNDGTDDVTFQTGNFAAGDYDDSAYPNYKISGHTPFYRITDKITMKKVLLFGSQGTSRAFEGNNDYNYNPPSPETIYYHGTVRLLPGFKTYPDQKVYIGPNIVVPPGTSDGDGEYLATTYFYDKYGRSIQTQVQNNLGGVDVSNTQYEFAGKVIRTKLAHTTTYGTVTVMDRYEYDHAGRLLKAFKQIATAPEVLVSQNGYNEIGQLISKKLHSTNNGVSFLQKVDYRYNIRGWLKSFNDPYNLVESGYNNDVFAFKLHYNDPGDYSLNNLNIYNGNISAMVWRSASSMSVSWAYRYEYDKLNRLKNANFSQYYNSNWTPSDQNSEDIITYDKNGNLKTLRRTESEEMVIDQLEYIYEIPSLGITGNKLRKVNDLAGTHISNLDFYDGSNSEEEYFYDQNGNMIQDKNKGINITYNYLNLPVTISWNANNINDKRKIEWLYDATGSKLRKTVYNTDGEATMVTDYVNGFVYNTNFGDALPQLSFFSMSEGRVVSLGGSSYELQYWLKDHLGNTRVAFRNNGGIPEVLQKDFYYPFGLSFTFGTQVGDENKFKYNGKELEDEHGLYWYHYGVRYYDPQLGRWHTMDPADEFNSPYLYVGNNPIKFIDPDGAQVLFPVLPGVGDVMVGSSDVMLTSWDDILLAGKGDAFFKQPIRQTLRLSKEISRDLPKQTPPREIKLDPMPVEQIVKATVNGEIAKWIAEGLGGLLTTEEVIRRGFFTSEESKQDATKVAMPAETTIKKQ